jgi:hypothetical protein
MFRLRASSLMPIMAGLLILTPLSSLVTRAAGISFPVPFHKGTVTVEEALKARCTHRSFGVRAYLKQFRRFCGVTAKVSGCYLKTAPSAGGLSGLS